VVLFDDAELVDDAELGGALGRLMALRRADVHVIAAGRSDVLRTSYGHWTGEIRRCRAGLVLKPLPDLDGELLQTPLPRRASTPFGPGRGYLVMDGEVELVQAAMPLEITGQISHGQAPA
jgi:S-DNA-T family DNA segregation ATPase FtsK/SpoIIIE